MIKKEFKEDVDTIAVPTNPIAAISRGAAIYGISFNDNVDNYNNMDEIRCIISSRVLKFTYGIEAASIWNEDDPEDRRTPDGYTLRFCPVAKRGTTVPVEKDITVDRLFPYYRSQTIVHFRIYYTKELDAKFCDEPGMELLGILKIDLPGNFFSQIIIFF